MYAIAKKLHSCRAPITGVPAPFLRLCSAKTSSSRKVRKYWGIHARACQALKGRRPTRCHRLGTRQDAAQLHLTRGFWTRIPMGGLAAMAANIL
jgi:hypothetical protein